MSFVCFDIGKPTTIKPYVRQNIEKKFSNRLEIRLPKGFRRKKNFKSGRVDYVGL